MKIKSIKKKQVYHGSEQLESPFLFNGHLSNRILNKLIIRPLRLHANFLSPWLGPTQVVILIYFYTELYFVEFVILYIVFTY